MSAADQQSNEQAAVRALDDRRDEFAALVASLNTAARAAQRDGYGVSYQVSRIRTPGLPDCPMIGVAVEAPAPPDPHGLPLYTGD
jgi:hypothetical protein